MSSTTERILLLALMGIQILLLIVMTNAVQKLDRGSYGTIIKQNKEYERIIKIYESAIWEKILRERPVFPQELREP